MVARNMIFSKPRLVWYELPSPPKLADNPDPLCWSKMAPVNKAEIAIKNTLNQNIPSSRNSTIVSNCLSNYKLMLKFTANARNSDVVYEIQSNFHYWA